MLVLRRAELDVDRVVNARCAVIAHGEGVMRGDAAAALMFADWAVLDPDAILIIDSPAAIAAAIWRGSGVLSVAPPASAALEAKRRGLVDAVGEVDDFLSGRSEIALDAAAALIRHRGGDALERATFAWLFATGEPVEGLAAFLEKRSPRFFAPAGPPAPH